MIKLNASVRIGDIVQGEFEEVHSCDDGHGDVMYVGYLHTREGAIQIETKLSFLKEVAWVPGNRLQCQLEKGREENWYFAREFNKLKP